MDVGVWLRSLGLGQYETPFRENDIDAEVLSDLTDGWDLERSGRVVRAPQTLAEGRSLDMRSSYVCLRLQPGFYSSPACSSWTPPSAASSPSCSATSSARPRCRRGSIPRTCAKSSAPTRTPARARSRVTTALSPSSWATACWPISAFRARMKTTPNGRCGPALEIAALVAEARNPRRRRR